MLNKYSPRGSMTFIYADGDIKYSIESYEKKMMEFYEETICGDLMSGHEFYEDVDCGGIIDYDGMLGNVFVDGYKSNLGLCHRGLCQGGFIVDGSTWLDLCDEFNVEVEWCNK